MLGLQTPRQELKSSPRTGNVNPRHRKVAFKALNPSAMAEGGIPMEELKSGMSDYLRKKSYKRASPRLSQQLEHKRKYIGIYDFRTNSTSRTSKFDEKQFLLKSPCPDLRIHSAEMWPPIKEVTPLYKRTQMSPRIFKSTQETVISPFKIDAYRWAFCKTNAYRERSQTKRLQKWSSTKLPKRSQKRILKKVDSMEYNCNTGFIQPWASNELLEDFMD